MQFEKTKVICYTNIIFISYIKIVCIHEFSKQIIKKQYLSTCIFTYFGKKIHILL